MRTVTSVRQRHRAGRAHQRSMSGTDTKGPPEEAASEVARHDLAMLVAPPGSVVATIRLEASLTPS
jgi:hypothetical protein